MEVDFIELHRLVMESFDRRLRRVAPADLARQTPCPDWNVGELIAHVVEADEWVRQLLDGIQHAEIQVAEDVLGVDPYVWRLAPLCRRGACRVRSIGWAAKHG